MNNEHDIELFLERNNIKLLEYQKHIFKQLAQGSKPIYLIQPRYLGHTDLRLLSYLVNQMFKGD